MICHVSSLAIDASVFDVPIINYCLKSKQKLKPLRNPNWMYELTHYQNILGSEGVRVARNKEELLEWINKYLNNSELDKEGRKRIVREQCWKMDGKAGERTANFLLKFLNS